MKFLYLLLCFLVLFACSSVEKHSYEDGFSAQNVERDQTSSRDIANLKSLSSVQESQFQFVIKQMKEVITNYSEMKRQILKIEDRLNRILVRNVIQQQQPQTDSEEDVQTDAQTDSQTVEQTETVAEKVAEDKNKEFVAGNNGENERENPPVSASSPLLQEDVTDSKDIFTDETTKNPSYIQDQQEALEKVVPKDQSSNRPKPPTLLKAEKLFKKKFYENAISAFQKYRDENPSGQYYPEATFYIGQSFKELKMPIEAKVFFQEILSSYPESLWADRSQKILKE